MHKQQEENTPSESPQSDAPTSPSVPEPTPTPTSKPIDLQIPTVQVLKGGVEFNRETKDKS